jgi:hypothetical protein
LFYFVVFKGYNHFSKISTKTWVIRI